MTGFAALLATGFLLAWALVTGLTVWRLRRPPRRTYAWAVARALPGDPGEVDPPWPFHSFTFTWRGLTLQAWDITGHDPAGPVVIATPGWGDSRLGILARLDVLGERASRVIAWDPPGHAESEGLCMLGSAEAAMIRQLIDEAVPEAERCRGVVLYGWSLGAGASIVAAAQRPEVCLVIAEAPYRLPWTPAINVLRLAGYPSALNVPPAYALLGLRLGVGPMWRGFDRAAHAARLSCPLLVLHGVADAVCPVTDGHEIARAAPEGLCIEVERAGHNDLWTTPEFRDQCTGAVRAVMDRVCEGRRTTATTTPADVARGSEQV